MEIKKNISGSLSYREKVSLPNGRVITKTFRRKADAIDWKRKTESEKIKNDLLGITPLKENLRFEEIFNLWMARKIEPVKSAKTIADYKSIGRKHLLLKFGSRPIRAIERGNADELTSVLKANGLANKTVNKILTVLKQILTFAEVEGYVANSPFRNFPMLKVNTGRIDFLSQQEILQLLRANASTESYPLLVVALNTGLRIGELAGLCWDRLNFGNDTIEVSRTLSRGELKDSTKTNLVRYVPMNFEVKDVLQKLMICQQSCKFVFAKPDGKPYNPDHYSLRYFKKALDRAGVRKVNFHVLRHTFASHYMLNGGNIYDLQKILGHTKVEMTMKYAHLSPDHLRKVMDTVRFSALGNQSVSPLLALLKKETEGIKAV